MRRADRWSTSADGSVLILAAVSACFFLGGLAGCLLAAVWTAAGRRAWPPMWRASCGPHRRGETAPPGPGRAGVGDSALAAAGPSAGLHGPGPAGPAPALRGAGVPAGLFHRLFRAHLRRYGLSACPAVFGVGGAFSVPALFVLGVQSFMTARTLAGGVWGESKAAPLYGRAIGCAAAGAPRLCVCVCCWTASRFPRWCPAWPAPCWPDRELCEKVLDGWIINRAMPTT